MSAHKRNTLATIEKRIMVLEEVLDDYYSKAKETRRKIRALKEEKRKFCAHDDVREHRMYDPGGGHDKTRSSLWYEKVCEDCGAVVALKGDRLTDEWREMPEGSTSSPYGVYNPIDGYVYTS